MKYDDVVVGAGISGLTVAVLLAQKGRKVCVVEQSTKIAPTIRGFVRDGTYFDTGFHYGTMFGPDEPFRELCQQLGIMSDLKVSQCEDSCGDHLYSIKGNLKFDYKNNLNDFATELICLFGDEKDSIVEFCRRIRVFLDRLNNAFFEVVMNPPNVFDDGNQSLEQYLDRNFKSQQLKTILSSHAMLYGSMPGETSVDYHSMICGSYYDRTWNVIGGGRAIVDAFSKKLQEFNITMLTSRSVDQIHVDANKKVGAVSTGNGETIECNNCVFTSHPRFLTSMLPQGALRPIYHSRLETLQDTFSAFTVYCQSEKLEKDADFNNIILVHDLFPDMFSADDVFVGDQMYINRSVSEKYSGGISIICPCSYSVVERWSDSVTSKRKDAYYEWKKRAGETIICVANKYFGDILGELRVIDMATPLTFRDYMHAPHGCLYGAKHHVDAMPLMPRTRIKGLYLSGQSIASAGVMGAMVSGFVTVSSMTGKVYGEALGK